MRKVSFNIRLVVKLLSILLSIEGFALLISAAVAFIYKGGDTMSFITSAGITFAAGLLCYLIGRNSKSSKISKREGFVFVSLVWILFSFFGMLPFYLGGYIPSVTDAFFETMSGFTTTGATILTQIEVLPHGILFWRCFMHWIGGMGIILLSIAFMPMLHLGNFQLFTAESPGPTYDKLHPRISETSRILWYVYIVLTAFEIISLCLAGMNVFDAVCHSFSTMGTGGFSTKDNSIAYWNSPTIEGIIIIFMIIASSNFPLLYWVFTLKYKKIKGNEEFGTYIFIILFFSLFLTVFLSFSKGYPALESLRTSLFHIVSLISTTGFTTTPGYADWGDLPFCILLIVMLIGGMAGSTAGGIKVARLLICFKFSLNEFKKSVHPNAIFPVRYNGKLLPATTVTNVIGFVLVYFLLVFAGTVCLASMGLTFDESLGCVISCIGDVGPGFGRFISNYAAVPDAGKWILSFLMLTGRLEIFTILLLFFPNFWKS